MLGAIQSKLAGWAIAPRSSGYRIAFVAIAFVVSFYARDRLHGSLPEGFPYLTFFPAIVVTTFFAGTLAGTILAVLCGLASWYFFIAPEHSLALTSGSSIALSFYVFVVAVDIALIHAMNQVLFRLEEQRATSAHLARSRELMFAELQHRVSNNLQVISSMLKFQRRGMTDPAARQALDVASGQLATVARVQRGLHDPSQQIVEIGDLLNRILPDVVETSGEKDRVSLHIDADRASISADQSVPFGLIVTELVSNAIEHALPRGGHLSVHVMARMLEETICLEVADDGPGFPADFDLATTSSLGLTIARQFSQQLGGTLDLASGDGATVRLDFPASVEPSSLGTN